MLIEHKIDTYTLMILYISKEIPDFTLVDSKMKVLISKFKNQVSKP